MNERIDQAVMGYARLEQRIARHMPTFFMRLCARCGAEGRSCCRPDVGIEAIESWWFRTVSSHVHGRWWPNDYQETETCPAMGVDGCRLSVGRPLICSSFFCEKMIRATVDPWELVLFAFLSDLPGWTLQVGRRKNIALLESADEADGVLWTQLASRIEQAAAMLNVAIELAQPEIDLKRKQEITLRLICCNPRFMRPMVRRRMLELLDERK